MGYSEVLLAESVYLPGIDGAPEKKTRVAEAGTASGAAAGPSGAAPAPAHPPLHVSLRSGGKAGDAPAPRKMLWGDDDFGEEEESSAGAAGRAPSAGGPPSRLSVQVDPGTPRMVSDGSWSDFSSMSLGSAADAPLRTPDAGSCGRPPTDSPTGMLSRFRSSSSLTIAAVAAAAEGEAHAAAASAARAAEPSIRSVSSIVCARRCKGLIHMVEEGFKAGRRPVPLQSGTGGAYCFLDGGARTVCVIKPADEEPLAPNNPKGYVGRQLGEPGFKPSVRVGEAGLREVAAFLLDHDGFAGVPRTALVRVQHEVLHRRLGAGLGAAGGGGGEKLASMQAFVSHVGDVGDQGAGRFPTEAVHRIGVLDIRLFNTDRHSGNILLRKSGSRRREAFSRAPTSLQAGLDRLGGGPAGSPDGAPAAPAERAGMGIARTTTAAARRLAPYFGGGGRADAGAIGRGRGVDLVPIDHGFCLPENLEPPYLEWLHWPQASAPFSQETLRYIASLDPREDVELLREELPLLRPECLRLVELTTTLLKKAAAAGMNLAELGTVVSRPVVGMQEDASKFERICVLARSEALGPASPRGGPGGLLFDDGERDDEDGDEDGEDDDGGSDEHLQFSLDDAAPSPPPRHEAADDPWGRVGAAPAMDALSVSPMIPHSQLAESASSCAGHLGGARGSWGASPESLSPEKIMRRQSSRLHQLSRPVFIPRNASGKDLAREAAGGFHRGAAAPQPMAAAPRRSRASSSVVERVPLFTSVSMDLSGGVPAAAAPEGPAAAANGVLSNLDGERWERFLAAFEREVDKLITSEWRAMQESMVHLFKPGTSCPV